MNHVGGCACGRLRFRSAAGPVDTGHCHCRICQRTTGAPVLGYASFSVAAFAYTSETPSRYASSARGAREFCAAGGTQIAFRRTAAAGTVDVNVGAMDEPGRYPAGRHIWCEPAQSRGSRWPPACPGSPAARRPALAAEQPGRSRPGVTRRGPFRSRPFAVSSAAAARRAAPRPDQ